MSEFTLDDGRKAEKVENKPDSLTKVTEVFVEPKTQKKLAQRVIEHYCVCDRDTETFDEVTGEVVSRVSERVCCDQGRAESLYSVKPSSDKSPMQLIVEDKINSKKRYDLYAFAALVVLQVLVLAYVVFVM
jgi:hypothetical protein